MPLLRVREGRAEDLFIGCFAAFVRNLDLRSMDHQDQNQGFVEFHTVSEMQSS